MFVQGNSSWMLQHMTIATCRALHTPFLDKMHAGTPAEFWVPVATHAWHFFNCGWNWTRVLQEEANARLHTSIGHWLRELLEWHVTCYCKVSYFTCVFRMGNDGASSENGYRCLSNRRLLNPPVFPIRLTSPPFHFHFARPPQKKSGDANLWPAQRSLPHFHKMSSRTFQGQ